MATKVEIVVLGLLAEQPMHGYDLLERFRARSMGFWTEVSRASVYQVLKRLGQMGPSAEEHSTLLIAGNVIAAFLGGRGGSFRLSGARGVGVYPFGLAATIPAA